MMTDSKTPSTRFAPGEAEQMVQAIRQQLRASDRNEAGKIFAVLVARLTPRIEARANTYFSYRRDLVEDAIQEAVVQLWERLSNLGDKSGTLHFERRFNQAFKSLLSDAFDRLSRRARMQEETPDTATSRAQEDGEPRTALSGAVSPDAARALEAILGEMSAQDLLTQVTDERHRQAFWLDVNGVPQEEIARELGCSARTVYNWNKATQSALRQYLERQHGAGHPEF